MKETSRTALAVLVAVLALIVAAGAGATASMIITGKQIKDGSITSRDVKNRSLKVKDLSPKATSKLRGATGPAGPAGPRGATGATGATGTAGISGFEVVTKTVSIPGFGGTDTLQAACPAGKKALSATSGYATAPLAGLDSVVSQVTRASESTFSASGLNLLPTSQTLSLDVVCATVTS